MNSFDEYVSFIFEDICREFTSLKYPKFETGRWWYKEDEIDIVGLNQRENKILLCECKWSKNKVNFGLLDDLKEKAKKVRWMDEDREEVYVLFSKSGFTDELKKHPKENEYLRLYSLKDMRKEFENG